jgi:uncharacterized protein
VSGPRAQDQWAEDWAGPDAQPWHEGHVARLASGVLSVQRCTACGDRHLPPTLRCPECFAAEQVDEVVNGIGSVVAVTTLREIAPRHVTGLPIGFCIVRLAEGPHILTRTESAEHGLVPGAAVHVEVRAVEGVVGPCPVVVRTPSDC